MKQSCAAILCAVSLVFPVCAQNAPPVRAVSAHSPYGEVPTLPKTYMERPKAGPVAIMRAADVKAGMQGVAWTVFQGSVPEAVPVEIIGPWKNAWGPRQDVILAKLGGKAAKTNVAGGMSGSPVYIDGKLVGAIALRISVFSPDAICGITPIEQMLEINAIDATRPANPKAPQQPSARAELTPPASLLDPSARLVPIDTPLTFSGFNEATLREFKPYFDQMGITAVQGGAAGALNSSKPAPGWKDALQPGEAIAGVLVSGDMSITGLGTVTYNDGKRVLGFGHSFFNLGPLSMPMSRGEVLMVLSSAFQPNKFANATEIAGALRQDRHSGIMGELGESANTIPVDLTVRVQPVPGAPPIEKKYHFDAFVHPKWTPFLMMLTTFNTLNDINSAAADEATFRLQGKVEIDGQQPIEASTTVVSGDSPMPAPMQLGSWWAEKFGRLFANPHEIPKVKRVQVVVDMQAERRITTVESAWLDSSEVVPGGELTGKVALQPWRGERVLREFRVKVPESITPGMHRLLLSDSDTLNRTQLIAGMSNRTLDLTQTISLINQERSNDRLYVSLVDPRPTVYADDRALVDVPTSVLNVMQSGRYGRPMAASAETAHLVESILLNQVVSGNAALQFTVK
ncbi:hypothetical protein [uncultured Paludibaculum sp.]|uniref:hypothetical protein n=1 Tax=uncultured Paludibaculum sp. TaxID=1765020 RepID=UPI002AABA4BB|nr:hypothetical protein [uncultured Paludibaculum sp.]